LPEQGGQQMYGWNESEALKMNADEPVPEDQRRESKSFIEKLKGDEDIKSFTSRRKTKAGKILDVWLTVTALADESGRSIEIAATELDLAWLAEKSEGNDENDKRFP
jgi:two-component system, chemotaxis family, CheB/CheR fusion protein